MDLLSINTIKELLGQHHTKLSQLMGQNFLINKAVLGNIVKAAQLNETDTVLEIGPGLGTLTGALAQKAKKVVSIEKDRAMIKILAETVKNYRNIEIIQGDILKINVGEYIIPSQTYSVVSNIPYYLTSPLIRKLLESKNPPSSIILMVQKEVAQRICAKPPHMNLLAVSVQFYAEPNIIEYVSRDCFWPKPNVDSAIIKIIPLKNRPDVNPDSFFNIVKAGFSHPRKQLLNNLSGSLKRDREAVSAWLLQHGINPTQRAQTLTIQNWINLAESIDGNPL